ncbi:MAG: hypothetical protein VX681_10445 [Myxococcota bacterium]|nr:hypothetical protein [Myxococcota bacterium]
MTAEADFNLLLVRVLLSALALCLLVAGQYLRKSGRGQTLRRSRTVALGLVAFLAFASAYNFFIWRHQSGIHKHDVYNYYMGSKYFPELGYFGLYECSVSALAVDSPGTPPGIAIRDLRNPLHRTVIDPLLQRERCRRDFTPQRWQQFQADVRWFRGIFSEEKWASLWEDQGYNPSPVWTLIGRPVGSLFPAEASSMRLLGLLDLVLVLVSLAFIGWAFGLEALCLAALVWAVNPMSRYIWIGDAFLRYPWLVSSIIGLCLLRKERYLGAGMLLALSSLLRIFPVLLVAGYGLAVLLRWRREGALDPGVRKFAIGFGVAASALVIVSVPVSGRGPGVYADFTGNIVPWSQITAWNSVGLRPLLSFSSRAPGAELVGFPVVVTPSSVQKLKDQNFASRRPYYLAGVCLLLLLVWRGVRDASDWEAAAMGFALMLVLTQMPSYYSSCMVVPCLLATRRPRIGIGLLIAMGGMCLASLYFYEDRLEFVAASVILLLVSLYTLLEMQLPAPAKVDRDAT